MSWGLNKNCNIWTPCSSGYSNTSFSSCGAAQPGALRVQLSAGSGSHYFELEQLTPNSKLTELPIAPGYIIVWHQSASCERHICTEFNPSTVKDDIFDRMHLSLDWRLGQYVTNRLEWNTEKWTKGTRKLINNQKLNSPRHDKLVYTWPEKN